MGDVDSWGELIQHLDLSEHRPNLLINYIIIIVIFLPIEMAIWICLEVNDIFKQKSFCKLVVLFVFSGRERSHMDG